MRLSSTKATFVAAALALTMPGPINGPAAAQESTEGMRFAAWSVRCAMAESGPENCWLIQSLFEEGTNSFLAEIRLGAAGSAENSQYVMVMAAPTGILLTSRPAFRVDGAPEGTPLNWHNCTESRCAASKTLTPEEVESLSQGSQMIIGYQRFMAPEPTVFAVSLMGVTAGLTAVRGLQDR